MPHPQGARQGYPIAAIHRPRFFVGAFSHHDQLWEARPIRRADTAASLKRLAAEPAIRYRHEGQERTLEDYPARNPTTGLLIARGDTILVERYQYARNDRQRPASFSMAKTVTAMLIGIALGEGHIRSLDDPAASHLPELAGTEFGRTALRHLLQMSSGVRFREAPSKVDLERLWGGTVAQGGPGGVAAVRPYDERMRWSGATFSYSSVETQVLGLVLARAVGRPVAEVLQERIWQPMGAEADASLLVDASGQEATYCCLNAVLRDYARLGLLLANDGRSGGRQLIPSARLREATSVADDRPDLLNVWPETSLGYGHQPWVFEGPRRMFALLGAYGQAIYVDPASRLVMVHTAVRTRMHDPNREALALWRGVLESQGQRGR